MAGGSGTIRVIKRDGSAEPFDVRKLAGVIWRVMPARGASYDNARQIAEAVELYIVQRCPGEVSSAAVFEMVLKALRYVGLASSARAAEAYRQWRSRLRSQLRVRYGEGRLTLWQKGWLCEFARRSWRISRPTARSLANDVEMQLIQSDQPVVNRSAVVEAMNQLVVAYGLADAVPVRQ